jgi:hypothetical protein
MSKKLLEKLEKYEQEAYDGCIGSDWLANIGEGFKFYIKECINKNIKPSINGFEKFIDSLAKRYLN